MTQPLCDDGDLEQHAGPPIADPWTDPKQTDWPATPPQAERGSPAGDADQ